MIVLCGEGLGHREQDTLVAIFRQCFSTFEFFAVRRYRRGTNGTRLEGGGGGGLSCVYMLLQQKRREKSHCKYNINSRHVDGRCWVSTVA